MPPCGVWTEKAVPANKVAEVVAAFNADGATGIQKKPNPDGSVDVVATFPPCADGSASDQPTGG